MREDIQPLEELEVLKNKADNSCENCPDDTKVGIKKEKKKSHGRNR
jgi:hypothetical protein